MLNISVSFITANAHSTRINRYEDRAFVSHTIAYRRTRIIQMDNDLTDVQGTQ